MKIRKTYWFKVVVFTFLISFGFIFSAQADESPAIPDLFVPVEADVQQQSAAEADEANSVLTEPTTADYRLVDVQFDALATADALNVQLTADTAVTLTKDGLETRAEGDFSWFGIDEATMSQAVLVVKNGRMMGTIHRGSDLFQVVPLADGMHAVLQIDPSQYPPEHGPEGEHDDLHGHDDLHAGEVAEMAAEHEDDVELALHDAEDNAAEEGAHAGRRVVESETPRGFGRGNADDAEETVAPQADEVEETPLDAADMADALDDTPADVPEMAADLATLEDDLLDGGPIMPEDFIAVADVNAVGDAQVDPMADASTTIAVIVAYTPAAAGQVTDIELLVQTAVDETNYSFQRSGVTTRLHLVDSYQTPYTESSSRYTDRSRFQTVGDGFMDEVHSRRNTYAADVAVLITRSSGTLCGLAPLNATAASAFALVSQNCATGYYSFGHEIGHLIGARHNMQVDPSLTPLPYAHGYYYEPASWRTIMSYNCPTGCTRQPNWSTPLRTIGGVPTGSAAFEDNVRVWNERAFTVANFRSTNIRGVSEAGDNFGRVLATGDFDGDGFDDLAIGAPYEDIGSLSNAGSVNIIYGTAGKLAHVSNQIWHQNTPGIVGVAESGDRFGFALTVGDFDGDGYDDLAVGVYGEDIGSLSNNGAVNVIYGGANGLTSVGDQLWHQNSNSIIGGAENGDLFGYALSSGDYDNDGRDDLAIGVPGESIGSVPGAGAVNVIYGASTGLTGVGDQLWHQNSTGINGVAEAYDNFGIALTSGDFDNNGRDDLAIGVSREDVGTLSNAGAVNVIYGRNANGLHRLYDQLWTQDSPNIVWAAEAGDLFGYALTAGDFDNNGHDDLAIGVPGEDIGSLVNAGVVNVIYGRNGRLRTANNQIWHQDRTGIAGVSEAHDWFGRSLAAADFDGNNYDDLAIGVSNEDLYGHSNMGAVNVLYGSSSRLAAAGDQLWHQNSSGILAAGEPHDRFGFALAAGDFDDNGRDDLAIGAPGEDIGNINAAGSVNVIYGTSNDLRAAGNQWWHQNR